VMTEQVIETREFGEVVIEDEEIITFPKGLPGFADAKDFVLLPLEEDSPFLVLQSVEKEELAFITLEPVSFLKDYEFEISEATQELLKLESEEDVGVLVIVTLKEKLKDMTVNLAAPIVVNVRENLARQVILDQEVYPLRHPLKPAPARKGSA